MPNACQVWQVVDQIAFSLEQDRFEDLASHQRTIDSSLAKKASLGSHSSHAKHPVTRTDLF